MLQHLKDKDILEHVHQQRPDTKWRLTHITNVLYRKIIKGIPFNDNLCMFRALMYQINQSFDIERDVKIRYLLIVLWNSDVPKNTFGGVKLEEIPKFKKVLNINVNIYSLSEDDKAAMVYKSPGLYEDTLYLDKYLNQLQGAY